ncbi:major facilitator superfamily protein [Sphingobium sp. SYK-6]|nr:major facilitator superfamily protein [Sphingobium sp. SYK-6]
MASMAERPEALGAPVRGAGYTLFLLFLANFLNVADRALLGIVVDPVKADLALSDTQMSIVSGTAFVLFNLLVGIFIARWVDHGHRKRILILGIALWSGATALTGLATGFWTLGLTRVLVGVGEATAFPVAISMISDLFSPARRPRSISIFQASTFVGLVVGSILAGVLAAAHGWRAMFVICGLSGFLLVALMMASMREPDRVREPAGEAAQEGNLLRAIGHLVRLPGFVALSLGMAFAGMAVSVLPTWAPAFLLRSHGVPLAAVGALIGPAVGLGGITGTIAAGMLASHLVRKRGADVHGLLVPMIAIPLAAPFYLVFISAQSLTLAMSSAAVMNFLLSSAVGPCIAVAVGIAPTRMRAVSSTLMLLALGIIGGAVAPLVVGWVSDVLAPQYQNDSLRYALATMAPTPLVAGALIWLASARIRARAPSLP